MRPSWNTLAVLALSALASCGGPGLVVEFDGVTLTIPRGAMPEGTIVDDLDVFADAPPRALPGDRQALSDVFAFTPHGLLFQAPIGVEMEFDGGGAQVEAEVLRLGDDMDDLWEPVAPASFESGVAGFETSTFSWYVVAAPSPAGAGRGASSLPTR